MRTNFVLFQSHRYGDHGVLAPHAPNNKTYFSKCRTQFLEENDTQLPTVSQTPQ